MRRQCLINSPYGHPSSSPTVNTITSFHLTDSLDIFTNTSINRVIHPNLYKAITSHMLSTKKLIRNNKGTLLVWYKSPSEWSSLLHNYAIRTGNTSGAIMTMYELIEGEDSVGEEFHALPEDIWRIVLDELEREGKGKGVWSGHCTKLDRDWNQICIMWAMHYMNRNVSFNTCCSNLFLMLAWSAA